MTSSKYSRTAKSPAVHQIKQDIKSARSLMTRVFLGGLIVLAAINLVAIVYVQFRAESSLSAAPSKFIEACRELCARYGLIETGNIAADAKAFLTAAQNDPNRASAEPIVLSQAESLLGKPAPAFRLPNDAGTLVSLKEFNQNGPVVVVFYYGYSCSHCVAQLFGIETDLQKFQDLQATVVAISADSPQHTTEKFVEYGRFRFPVLADEDRNVSIAYGCYRRATIDVEEDMLHGTFLVDRRGIVRWMDTGYEPFLDNEALLAAIRSFEQAE